MSAETARRNDGIVARISARLAGFIRNEDGPTATEYAVMLALIVVAAMGALGTLGQNLFAWYVDIQAALFA